MFKSIKSKNLIEIENSCKSFAHSKSGEKICVLPPVIKKVGMFHHLCFFVAKLDKTKQVKAPTYIIETNKNLDIKNVYNVTKLQAFNKYDFDKNYYSLDDNPNFLPNSSDHVCEKQKVALDTLSNAIVLGLQTEEGKTKYKKYLKKVKDLFPTAYYCFYSSLIKNGLNYEGQSATSFTSTPNSKKNTKLIEYNSQNKNSTQTTANKIPSKNDYIESPSTFLKRTRSRLGDFIRKEVVPYFKNKGSYAKLAYYDMLGKYLKEKFKDQDLLYNCLSKNLTNSQRFKNTSTLLDELKVGAIKTYVKACDSVQDTTIKVDTLCKILIVFLNAMLVEEIEKQTFKTYEEEIEESIQIFNETIASVDNAKSKGFLIEIFNDLMSDYREVNENKFSNTYYAYLTIFKTKQ